MSTLTNLDRRLILDAVTVILDELLRDQVGYGTGSEAATICQAAHEIDLVTGGTDYAAKITHHNGYLHPDYSAAAAEVRACVELIRTAAYGGLTGRA